MSVNVRERACATVMMRTDNQLHGIGVDWLTGTKRVADKARPEGYKEGRNKMLEEMEPILSQIGTDDPSKVRHVGKLLPLMR